MGWFTYIWGGQYFDNLELPQVTSDFWWTGLKCRCTRNGCEHLNLFWMNMHLQNFCKPKSLENVTCLSPSLLLLAGTMHSTSKFHIHIWTRSAHSGHISLWQGAFNYISDFMCLAGSLQFHDLPHRQVSLTLLASSSTLNQRWVKNCSCLTPGLWTREGCILWKQLAWASSKYSIYI